MLFYQEVEKEIEQETTVKLEGFIVMKTRPIHNSAKQWFLAMKRILSFSLACQSRMSVLTDILPSVGTLPDIALLLLLVSLLL